MKIIIYYSLIIIPFILYSCAPSLQYTAIETSRAPKTSDYNIRVLNSDYNLPSNAKIIGTIYIGDTGLSVGCGYDDVIILAKEKARNVGGDAIQVTEINYPDLRSTCYRIRANIIAFEEIKTPTDWIVINKTEADFRKYLDENSENLDQIEGIWSVNEGGRWRNLSDGTTGNMPDYSSYRIAIIKENSFNNYDYIGVIIESEKAQWKQKLLKAKFRKTAYDKVFEGLWYMSDFSEKKGNYLIDDVGIMKNETTFYQDNFEVNSLTTFIKAYPQYSGRFQYTDSKNLKASGSGLLLNTAGLIITNYHVIENAKKIEVIFPFHNLSISAIVKIKDTKNDIAILELSDFSYSSFFNQSIPYILADANSVKVGEEVFTLGFPLGEIMGTKSRLSTGRINSKYGLQDDPRLFQISNPLQPGNSGGPLFNNKGELVGLVVSSLNAKYFYENVGVIPQNVNFAIKSTYIQNLISMIPEGDEIAKRKTLVKQTKMEEQIEQLNPFVVQIKVY